MGIFKIDKIDISFDVYSDTPESKDPDSFSSTLRNYHKVLWSKSLPNNKEFHLDMDTPKLLHHKSTLGEFFLSSDSIGHTLYCLKPLLYKCLLYLQLFPLHSYPKLNPVKKGFQRGKN